MQLKEVDVHKCEMYVEANENFEKNVHTTQNAVFFKVLKMEKVVKKSDMCTMAFEYPIMGTKIPKKTLCIFWF